MLPSNTRDAQSVGAGELELGGRHRRCSPSPECCRSLVEKSLRPLGFVFGPRAEPEQRRLECQALGLAGLESTVDRLEREPDRDRSIGKDLFQDRLGAWDQ